MLISLEERAKAEHGATCTVLTLVTAGRLTHEDTVQMNELHQQAAEALNAVIIEAGHLIQKANDGR